MKDQKLVRVGANTPVEAPFKQSVGMIRGHRQEWALSRQFENHVVPDVTSEWIGMDDPDVVIKLATIESTRMIGIEDLQR